MALLSPGVQVTVIDQSQYIPAATNSVPYILLATAQNKISGSGVGVAAGTLAVNANKTYLISSQRDLLATFGNPFFYTTTTGVPINGYELNEYGLLAAYSSLGVSNRCYVQRVDIDLSELTATLTRPTGSPNNGTYWFDTADTSWGVFEWNQTTGVFTNKIPTVITSTTNLENSSTTPLQNFGSIGDYAVTANTAATVQNPTYYKRGGPTTAQAPGWSQDGMSADDLYNTWVLVGSDEWKTAWPIITGTVYNPTLSTGNSIVINNQTVVLSGTTVGNLVVDINNANIPGVFSANVSNSLQIFADSNAGTPSVDINSAASINGNTQVQFTFSSVQGSAPFSVGQNVAVTGASVSSYNANYLVTACTTTTATVSSFNQDAFTGNARIFFNNTGAGLVQIANGTGNLLGELGISASTYNAPVYLHTPSYNAPRWNSSGSTPEPTGSVWQKINNVNLGTDLIVKQYNSTLGTFVQQACPVFSFESIALNTLDPSGGGQNIPAGTTIGIVDTYNNNTATLEICERYASGPTIITAKANSLPVTFVTNDQFLIQATEPASSSISQGTIATLLGNTAADFQSAVSAAAVPYVSAGLNSAGQLVFTHSAGGTISLQNLVGTPVTTAGFTTDCRGVSTRYNTAGNPAGIGLSNWVSTPTFTYAAGATAPDQDPATGRLWYYSDTTAADIMIQATVGGVPGWYGYQNVTNDVRGYDLSATDPNGPLFSATAPTVDSQGNMLAYGQLWIDTSDLENYPLLSRWENVNGQDQWVLIDTTDQTTNNGILFADARWATNGSTNPVSDALPTIAPGGLITSNYLDPDAPPYSLFPQGMLLWNTRRSGFNVKKFEPNYFNQTTFPAPTWSYGTNYYPGQLVTYNGVVYNSIQAGKNQQPDTSTAYWAPLLETNTWLTAGANTGSAITVVGATAVYSGVANFGRHAQRRLIVEAMKSGLDTSVGAREEVANFNLIATPGYPELIPNMAVLNNDRNNTAFVVGDTPLRLAPADVVAWETNNNGLGLTTGDGLVTYDPYVGVFYPSCQTTDLSGNQVATYPSHMMVRTIIRSDEVSYPWFAPAGTQRGVVDNAVQLGYVNAQTGAFNSIGVNQALRDVLYQANINPITFIPGVGITNFGNKTTQTGTTALDRINVARLVAFIRSRLESIGKQYLFEPNDQITRDSIRNAINSLMIDLIAKRGIYDYLVVCDLTNNTPSRIDANELWVDIAIEPVKAVEFVYIPLRIQNTGSIASAATA